MVIQIYGDDEVKLLGIFDKYNKVLTPIIRYNRSDLRIEVLEILYPEILHVFSYNKNGTLSVIDHRCNEGYECVFIDFPKIRNYDMISF